MSDKTITGTVTFINHEKDYATIEYTVNGKTKTINGNISEKEQEKLKVEKIIKKVHRFHVGDEVSFIITLSGRGDRMIADCIEYRYNNALDNLINKAMIENRLVGYLKKVEADYFVKETGSYIFFPLVLSPWERRPKDLDLNEPVFFKLENLDKPDKVTAALFRSDYIPEYMAAMRYFKEKRVIDATVYKVTPHGIFVHVVGDKVSGKIPISKKANAATTDVAVNVGDKIKILISYLGPLRIVLERATE